MKPLFTAAVITVALGASAFAQDREPRKPNIVFILADDYGLDGVGCYGSDRFKGKTPSLDRLAESGARFTQCYAMPLCGPSRCAGKKGKAGRKKQP